MRRAGQGEGRGEKRTQFPIFFSSSFFFFFWENARNFPFFWALFLLSNSIPYCRPIKDDEDDRDKRESKGTPLPTSVEGRRKPRTHRKGSPRRRQEQQRRSKRTHFQDLRPKRREEKEGQASREEDARNLTESLADDHEKVGEKETIGRKKGRKKERTRRRSKEEEEELLECLQLIEIAKDRLLDAGKGEDGEEEGGERAEGSTDVSLTLSRLCTYYK